MFGFIYFVSFLNILIGAYSLKINYKSKINILFSVLAFFTSAIMITNVLIILREHHLLWEKFNLLFVVWVPTLYILWTSEITNKKLLIRNEIFTLISFIFSFSLLSNLFIKDLLFADGKFTEIFGPLFNLFFIYYSLCFIYGLILVYRGYVSSYIKLDRKRNLFVFIGTLVPILTSLVTNFLFRYLEKYDELLRGNIIIFPITNIIMMCFFGYSVIKYNFLKEDITVKEHLDSLRIKIIYLLNIIIIISACLVLILLGIFREYTDLIFMRIALASMILMALITISINKTLGKYIQEKIVIPIEKISNHAEEVGKGNFSNKVGFDGEDEIAILSRQMDEMTEKLKKTSEIRDNFNKALQMEVQIKTAKLQETYDQLKEADKAKKDFIDAIAHELYNPLAIISLSDEFINWDTIGPDNKKMITSIHRNVKRLNELVKEIEEFNLIGRHENKLNIEQVDLKELITLISQDFIILANNKKIDFSVSSSGKNFTIEGDIKQLTKVFVNLMENAINFSNEGGEIKVKIEEKEDNIEVKIKDKGIGIREKDIDRVFEKFYRAKVDNELMQGIGLGLPISLDIVTKHGGFINVKSKYGEGSTFKVILPKKHVIL